MLGSVIFAISAPVHHGLTRLGNQLICNIRIFVDSPLVRRQICGLRTAAMATTAALSAIVDVAILLLLCASAVVLRVEVR